jgi:PKD repeat protein
VGQRLTIVVSATDPDGDAVGFTASGLPAGASFTTNTFSWTPSAAGSYSVTFIATDGQLTDSETVTITVVQPKAASDFKNVGYISIYFLDSVLNRAQWEQYSHVIWQNVWVTSPSDPTLRVQDGYPWSQISNFVATSHANGVKALACLFGTYDLVGVTSNPALRAQLVSNLTNMVNTYNLDGINIDWEGGNDPEIYATFIRELRASLGPDKVISAIGTWLGPPVNISASAAPYLDFVTVMTYDYWHVPSNGSLDVVAGSMNMWANAGFPKEKLVMGIPFFATTGAGEKYYPLPLETLSFDPVNKMLYVAVDRETIEEAPAFDRDRLPNVDREGLIECTPLMAIRLTGEKESRSGCKKAIKRKTSLCSKRPRRMEGRREGIRKSIFLPFFC